MPAASTCSFINPLSRNVIAWRTSSPGTPIASRNRAAVTTSGSHSVSTRSTLWPFNERSTVATAPASSNQLSILM